jgi:hypothetical protein
MSDDTRDLDPRSPAERAAWDEAVDARAADFASRLRAAEADEQRADAPVCQRGRHKWEARPWDAPRFFVCTRCGEPGWEVPA